MHGKERVIVGGFPLCNCSSLAKGLIQLVIKKPVFTLIFKFKALVICTKFDPSGDI